MLKQTNHTGFTLTELMITLAVAGILLTIAVPSFISMIKNNRLSTQANEFVTSINYARSEAIRRGNSIKLVSGSADWHKGWTIVDSDDKALRIYSALNGTSTLTGTANDFTYLGTGFLSGETELTFDLCDDRVNATGRRISISVTGRPSVSDITCNAGG